jgi:hypothetical protein
MQKRFKQELRRVDFSVLIPFLSAAQRLRIFRQRTVADGVDTVRACRSTLVRTECRSQCWPLQRTKFAILHNYSPGGTIQRAIRLVQRSAGRGAWSASHHRQLKERYTSYLQFTNLLTIRNKNDKYRKFGWIKVFRIWNHCWTCMISDYLPTQPT